MADREALIEQEQDDGTLVVTGVGDWVIDQASLLDRQLGSLDVAGATGVRLDLGGIASLDTAGAWVLARACGRFRDAGLDYRLIEVPRDRQALLDEVAGNIEAVQPERANRRDRPGLFDAITAVGAYLVRAAREVADFIAFLGLVLACLGRLVLGRERLEAGSVFHHMQQVWLSAMPIVGLLSFLIGVVTLYQGSTQLARFGAQTFAVDLVGITVLREIGALISAVIVAGRSGSSFTAQIGSMQARQEIDAMRAIGIDPITTLVVPRVLALLITFPLLVFFADAAGLFGGALVAWLDLGIRPEIFLERLRAAVDLGGLFAGLAKAPVFAVLIGLVGCFQGMKVEGSAAEVGARTTRSVVQAIFLVIFVDALFSLLYRVLGI